MMLDMAILHSDMQLIVTLIGIFLVVILCTKELLPMTARYQSMTNNLKRIIVVILFMYIASWIILLI